MNFYEHWIGAYRKKTAALNATEHGVYRLLLDEYYAMDGSLPGDLRILNLIARTTSKREREALVKIIENYFTKKPDGFLTIEKGEEEIAKAMKRLEVARENGKKGGRPRKENPGGSSRVNPEANLNLTQKKAPHTTGVTTELQGLDSPKNGESLSGKPDDGQNPLGFEEQGKPLVNGKAAKHAILLGEAKTILAFLNDKAGKRFPANDTNVGIIVARLREGFTPKQVRQVVAMKVREWSADDAMREYLRPMTLFGKTKFSNYVGELKVVPDEPAAPGALTRERVDE